MDNYLVTDKGYEGKYVALRSPSDNTVVGSGTTPEEASNLAHANGCATPILLYVEESNLAQIYASEFKVFSADSQ
jgi:hypothetical protein